MFFWILVISCVLVSNWFLFKKLGRQGWEGIIPLYNDYVLLEKFEGNGMKCVWLLVPFVNLYISLQIKIHLAKAFNKGTEYAFGLFFLPVVFYPMLAFGNAVYGDGSMSNTSDDILTNAASKVKSTFQNISQPAENVSEKLKELEELHTIGILSQDEYLLKKAELIKKL